jgi:hypothetical protein
MTYKVQIDDTIRDATPEEVAIIETQRSDAQAIEAAAQSAVAAKQSARNKLKALGLTDAEIAALVG